MAKTETAKTFTIAGISTKAGVNTFRFSNGQLNLRVNMLNHKGHEDIQLFELPRAMSQKSAIAWVLENVKGSKGAVISTRAADKTVKSDVVVAAEELVAKRRAKARDARRAEREAAAA